MKALTFLDSNVLVYADDAAAGAKQKRCRTVIENLIAEGRLVISTQVIAEYFSVASRKLRLPFEEIRERIEFYSQLQVVVVVPPLILEAADLHRAASISFWDALILTAARAAGCSLVVSEDLAHGQSFDGVRVESPFARA